MASVRSATVVGGQITENSGCNCPPYDCAERVRRYLAGQSSAVDELVEKFRPLVWTIVAEKLGNQRRDEWEDCCQTVWMRVLSKVETWEARCPFCKWLAVVTARLCIDWIRPRQVQYSHLEADVAESTESVSEETIDCITAAVDGFPPHLKRLFELKLLGAKHNAIAEELGKSVRTIQYWLEEMRQLLKHCLH